MAAKFEKLKEARLDLIAEITHITTRIQTCSTETSAGEIRHRFDALKALYDEFTDNKRELAANANKAFDDDERKMFRTENNTISESVIVAKGRLQELMPDEERETNSSTKLNLSGIDSTNHIKSNFKLPPIKIRTFTGEYTEWEDFKDVFEACFCNDSEKFSDSQKLLYLKGSLSGEPFNLIKGLSASNSKFSEAWEQLHTRYQHKRKIFEAHANAITSLPKMSEESSQQLKNIIDTTNSSLIAIKAIGVDMSKSDALITHLLTKTFDKETMKHWAEELKNNSEVPEYKKLEKFIQMRITILESISSSETKKRYSNDEKSNALPDRKRYSDDEKSNAVADRKRYSDDEKSNAGPDRKPTISGDKSRGSGCSICPESHRPWNCKKFLDMTAKERHDCANDKQLCTVCLYSHPAKVCKSRSKCNKCSERHNTLLHEKPQSVSSYIGHLKEASKTLLATAIIPVHMSNGMILFLRALIDPGSMSALISESATQKLKLKRRKTHVPITSIADSKSEVATSKTHFIMGSCHNKQYKKLVNALVISKITDIVPSHTSNQMQNWEHINGLQLADPTHAQIGPIDILLGAEEYAEILTEGLRKGERGTPVAQNTKLGWILFGSISSNNNPQSQQKCNLSLQQDDQTEGRDETSVDESLDSQFRKFWEIEEISPVKILTLEETEAEEKFCAETTVENDGKFMVRLPFKLAPNDDSFLGNSYNQALMRLKHLERRFKNDHELFISYKKDLQEAIELKHLRKCSFEEIEDKKNAYFMPHHPVIKKTSTTTKVRIVYDASARTSNGFSLNDRLLVGPTIQSDIFSILLNWRLYKVGFTSDIEKMYKQVWVHPEDAKFQRILWRENPSESPQQFISTTVTFGTASAPFQAIRAIRQVALNEAVEFPAIVKALHSECYVDDIVSGGHTEPEAFEKYQHLTNALKKYGFNLRKWSSNSSSLLTNIPIEHLESNTHVEVAKDSAIKALGIQWAPETDTFTYKAQAQTQHLKLTKRKFLSEVCKLYDPLGWISPIIIKAKILTQTIWKYGTKWDEPIPNEILEVWNEVAKELHRIESIRINRWIEYTPKHKVSIHAFSDASEAAYAAVVYMRIETENDIHCHVLASKTKVSPLKKVSLPRLELCGAVLLTKLIRKIQQALPDLKAETHAWTDSKIVLAWLANEPYKWQTFVANRVTSIQKVISYENWHHVQSEENPADIASRGAFPEQLVTDKQWWHGPQFLQSRNEAWRVQPQRFITMLEEKQNMKVHHVRLETNDTVEFFLNRWSCLTKICRMIAYWLRLKTKYRQTTTMSAEEILRAEKVLIRETQKMYFSEEYKKLNDKQQISNSSKISALTPFLDSEGIIRVRGRLEQSDLNYDQKHPMILPANDTLTTLIIRRAHLRVYHEGVQSTLRKTREKYWIIRGRHAIKAYVLKCVPCRKFRAQTATQIMADLPATRVKASAVFSHVGVDFAGPFDIKTSALRNAKTCKGYICLFVCFCTKAIHLEVATNLSTPEFIACYKRFVATRGRPSCIYSDCGSNFVGASGELPRMVIRAHMQQGVQFGNELANNGTQWRFMPPNAPHFGGLWEAGVKSTKTNLIKAFGNTKFTYESFNTALKQVEAILNSRPLYPINEDPDDCEVLTPAHFLIGRPMTLVPESSVLHINVNRLDLYQRQQQTVEQFWETWSNEYLHRMQARSKWRIEKNNVEVGQIALLHEKNTRPSFWKLARITKTFPDQTGVIRVVEIQCGSSRFTRPIHKLAILPINEQERLNA